MGPRQVDRRKVSLICDSLLIGRPRRHRGPVLPRYLAHCLGQSQEVAKLAVLDCASDEDAEKRALGFSEYPAVEVWCGSRWVCQVNPVKRGDEVSSRIAGANALLKDHRAEDAMAEYKAAVELDPLNADAHCGIGKALH